MRADWANLADAHPGDKQIEYFVNCLNINEVNCCNYLSVCAQRKIWSEIENTMNSILNQTTIYDLVQQTFKLIPKSNEKK